MKNKKRNFDLFYFYYIKILIYYYWFLNVKELEINFLSSIISSLYKELTLGRKKSQTNSALSSKKLFRSIFPTILPIKIR